MTDSFPTAGDGATPVRTAAACLRWLVISIDLALGTYLSVVGAMVSLGHSVSGLIGLGVHEFHSLPDEVLGLVFLGQGLWVGFSGIRLLTERDPVRCQAGNRRHLIAAGLSGATIGLLWLALMVDSRMHSGDGFGMLLHVLVNTCSLAVAVAWFLVVSAVMRRSARPSG